MNILEVDNLSVKIDDFILNIDKLEIKKGELFEIKGANGSGKTVLLNTFLGFMNYSGSLKINTSSIYGFINKDFLVPYLTPLEYFKFIGEIHHNPDYEEKYLKFSEKLNLLDLIEKKYIRNLSEGNKMKTGIISILALYCEIMVFDEPFAYLDKESCEVLCRILNEKRGNNTIIYTSHENNNSLVPDNTYKIG